MASAPFARAASKTDIRMAADQCTNESLVAAREGLLAAQK